MYGVCRVFTDFGGGGGYYVGGVCRTTRLWWDGRAWMPEPNYVGTFETKDQASAFARGQNDGRKINGVGYFVYPANDPWGETAGAFRV